MNPTMKQLQPNSLLFPALKKKVQQLRRTHKKTLSKLALTALAVSALVTYFDITVLDTKRFLSTASTLITGDQCKWIAPEFLSTANNRKNTTLLLTSYPGSGKRLTWRMFEALTGE